MASKVRLFLQFNESYYRGGRVYRTLREVARNLGVTLPDMTGLPRWQQCKEIIRRIPSNYQRRLVILREPRRVDPKHSKYVQMMKDSGYGRPILNNRARRSVRDILSQDPLQPSAVDPVPAPTAVINPQYRYVTRYVTTTGTATGRWEPNLPNLSEISEITIHEH